MIAAPAGSATLAGLSDALSLIAALTKLEATEVLVDVVPDTTAPRRPAGPEALWFTRTYISTFHEMAAYDLASVLQLAPRPRGDDVAGWEGLYPLSSIANRPLRVELALTEAPGPVIALGEVLGFLDVVTAVVPDSIPVTRVHVRALEAGGEAEIRTTHPGAAQILLDALAGLELSVRLVAAGPGEGHAP